jgi:hypothetical protein
MISPCVPLTFNGDLSKWNVAKVTNMEGVFRAAFSFGGNITAWEWDVSKVTSMFATFQVSIGHRLQRRN